MPPEKCWAYLLAFLLSGLLAWQYVRVGTPWRKWIPGGVFALLTTAGSVALARWGVQDTSPAMGVFWVAGLATGGACSYRKNVRDLVAGHKAGLAKEGRRTLVHEATRALRLKGFDDAHSVVKTVAAQIEDKQQKELDRVRLVNDLARKAREIRDLEKQVARLQSEIEHKGAIITRSRGFLLDACQAWDLAILTDYKGGWTSDVVAQLLQVIVDRLAARMSLRSPVAVAIYEMPSDVPPPESLVSPRIYSKKSYDRDGSGRVPPWICNEAVSSTDSLVAACANLRRAVRWPQGDILDEPLSNLVRASKLQKTDWPDGLAVPIPLVEEPLASNMIPKPFGVILIRTQKKGVIGEMEAEYAAVVSKLVDTLLRLSREANTTPSGDSVRLRQDSVEQMSKKGDRLSIDR